MKGKEIVKVKNNAKILKIPGMDSKKNQFPIVAIGASAGGLEAFEKFFIHLSKVGMAYVLITHLDRNHASFLPDLLRKYTSLPVILIKNNMRVKPNTIYVIPTKKNVIIKNGILNLIKQNITHYKNLPINLFFESLADDRKENAIAIILSGSGADGSLGIRAIKDVGGLTIAQDPSTASFDSMPRNAINTGLIDYVMEVEAIPEQIVTCFNNTRLKYEKSSLELQEIFTLLRMHTQHDFSQYKLNTIIRRIEKQMYSHHIKNMAEYVRFLHLHLHEIDNLFKDLLIGVTRFFRDGEAFNAFKKQMCIFLRNKPQNAPIRIWIPACSTGEEAYSIAIIFRECMDEMKKHFNVQIFATDIDAHALGIARAGIYPLKIMEDISPERLKNFFFIEHNQYKVNKEIRSMVIFGEQNVIKDPPFTKLDVISCRNLLIYLNMRLQAKLLPIFHYSLKPNGILFLGISEATSGLTHHFELIVKKWKIFERKNTITEPRAILEFAALSNAYDSDPINMLEQKPIDKNLILAQTIQAYLLKECIPPCIVINKKGDILYVHRKINKHLLHIEKSQLSIHKHLHSAIQKILISAMHANEKKKGLPIYRKVEVNLSKKKCFINIRIIPINNIKLLRDLTLIIIEEDVSFDLEKIPPKLKSKNLKIEEVINELQYTKESLQATVEQLESGNEELQSTNEELQSTNEEIETSREELQSLNEELIIVNTELQNMIDQLANINDDMTNLFNSTEIAALFLDNNLKIKRFTPKIQKFIHLIETDIGRPINHFSTTIKYHQLTQDAKEVLKTLNQKSIEVMSEDGLWYNIRILPYKTLSNVIDGVVITLTDISRFKEYEKNLTRLNDELQISHSYNESIIDTLPQALVVLNIDLKIISANKAFYEIFDLTSVEVIEKYLYALDKWNIKSLEKPLKKFIKKNEVLKNYEFKNPSEDKRFLVNAGKICNSHSDLKIIFLVMEQVND